MNDALIAAVVQYLGVPLVMAAGAWLATKIPGPLKAWLESGTHQRDMELLVGALSRYAMSRVAPGMAAPAALVAAEASAYVQQALPDTLAKLGPSADALMTMALAAVKNASAVAEAPVVIQAEAGR